MTKEEILEGNKLIDAFMEVGRRYGFGEHNDGFSYIQSIHYHSSWDWLMPVVEKIESLDSFSTDCRVTIIKKECQIFYANQESTKTYTYGFFEKDKITSVYKSVIEFIKWHNENK